MPNQSVSKEFAQLGLKKDHVEVYCRLRDAQIGSFIRCYGKFFKLMDKDCNPMYLLLRLPVYELRDQDIIRIESINDFDSIVHIVNPFL